jgi:8-oxo-dGTP diphosphatase
MSAQLREVCRALIVDGETNRVLLGKRADTDNYAAGEWALFGGKVDPGETPLQAVVREIREETRLRFTPQEYLTQENTGWRTYFFTGSTVGRLTLRLAEHSEAAFFTLEEIADMHLAFDHQDVVTDYMRSLMRSGDTPYSA